MSHSQRTQLASGGAKRYLMVAWAFVARLINGFPDRKLKIYAVTGSRGKTTTCHILATLFQEYNKNFSLITSQSIYTGKQYFSNHDFDIDNPSPLHFYKLLKSIVVSGVDELILEVSPEGMATNAYAGLKFHTAVYLNYLPKKGQENSAQRQKSMLKIFATHPQLSVVNGDDQLAEDFAKMPSNKVMVFAQEGYGDVVAKKVFSKPNGSDFVLLSDKKQATINFNIPGQFNVSNALAAASVMLGFGFPIEATARCLNSIEAVPGRMEAISAGQPYTIIIDNAKTPDDLQRLYDSLKPVTRGRLICVAGASGTSDVAMRPILGAVMGRYCDMVYLTSEDTGEASADEIVSQIAEGVPRGRPKRGRMKVKKESSIMLKYRETGEDIWWWRIIDRQEAIESALALARSQDTVVVSGKGAEDAMLVGKETIDWDDRGVVSDYLSRGKNVDKGDFVV